MLVQNFRVQGDHVRHTDQYIESDFDYVNNKVIVNSDGIARVEPIPTKYTFRTNKRIGRVGVMLVGWGGNNGSTLTAGIIANKHNLKWRTKEGTHQPNYRGSIVMSSTVRIGANELNDDVFTPLRGLLPMIHPNDLVIGGWDICADNLAIAMNNSKVLDVDLQNQIEKYLADLVPLPAIFYPGFIADNQNERTTNILSGNDKSVHLERIRHDIRDFKSKNQLDKVIVIWTASTERFVKILPGVNDTSENLLASIENSHEEISPSTLYAVASILENSPYINGSPQNTFVPGCVELAENLGVFIGGDDFKSGQTKFKSCLVDFLINAGIRPSSIVSYNHLGNNDGKNLSSWNQFFSKQTSKSNVVDDLVRSNQILYPNAAHEPDHVVVIKYVPNVGDSKRAMDEYISDIFMGGKNTIVTHNTCEDSLLAAPLILDLVILAELATRITYKTTDTPGFVKFHPVLSFLSYLLKAPIVPSGMPIVNSLFKQRACIENILRVCSGLAPENDMRLEHRALPPYKVFANGY